jgi:hypothetical protein
VPDAQKSIAFFIALGAGLICVIILLYVGWVLLNWRHGILLFLGALLMTAIVSGVVLNTIFLVREIRRNAQHDAFINAVTHELKTPIASIRLYLETLQTRAVDDAKRQEFYRIMVDDSERLLGTIEQVLRTGRIGASSRRLNLSRIDLGGVIEQCVQRVRALHKVSPEGAAVPCRSAGHHRGRCGRSAGGGFEPHRQRGEVLRKRCEGYGGDRQGRREVCGAAGDRPRAGHREDRAEAHLQALLPRAGSAGDAREGNRPGPVYRAVGGQTARRPRLGRERGSGARGHFRSAASHCEMSRILVVEDEQHLAEGLRFNLEAEGYQVQVVDTGEAALEYCGPNRRRSTW